MAANYLFGARSSVFVTVKNLTDRLVIGDRTRGLPPGMPRLVQVGLVWSR
jgi:Fe(3+) dicitrate transport protein